MTTTSELNALDHCIYTVINRIRGQNKRTDRNSVHKEITKTIDFEKISKSFLDDRINMLIQNDKIINKLNRNKDSFRIADNDFNSSITDVLPMTLSHFYLLPVFLLHVTRVLLITSFKERYSLIRLAMKLNSENSNTLLLMNCTVK